MTGTDQRFDVVVVGGGAAGLGGALALARARRSVLVVDAGAPRNAPASHVHHFLGHDGTSPAKLGAIARSEVQRYGGTVLSGHATALRQEDNGFGVDLSDGRTFRARRLLVATGLTDELPDLPGVSEAWGRSVVHCPYCHGWEVRDRPVGVLGAAAVGAFQALLWRQWSDDVVYFQHTAAAPNPQEREQLSARGIRIVTQAVTGLDLTDGDVAAVRLADGEAVERQVVVVAPRFVANTDLLADLGLKPVDQEVHGSIRGERIPADPVGLTEVPGVWVAGNLADVTAQVMASAVQGLMAASAINVDLVVEDTRSAVLEASNRRV